MLLDRLVKAVAGLTLTIGVGYPSMFAAGYLWNLV